MTEELDSEHNRLFRKAAETIKGEIPLHGKPGLPVPGWLLARKLRHAIVLFEHVLELNPHNWSAMWLVGKVYQRFGNTAEALSWFERSSQVNPSQPDVAREASICAMEIGNNATAIAFAQRASQIDPNNSGLRANLALAYLLAGRVPDAQTAIEQALAGAPSDTISRGIQAMAEHFASNGRLPPTTTPDLLRYWRQNHKSTGR